MILLNHVTKTSLYKKMKIGTLINADIADKKTDYKNASIFDLFLDQLTMSILNPY